MAATKDLHRIATHAAEVGAKVYDSRGSAVWVEPLLAEGERDLAVRLDGSGRGAEWLQQGAAVFADRGQDGE